MYIDSLDCARVKEGVSKLFRINSGLHHVPLAFNVYMDAMMTEVKMGMGRRVRFMEGGREWRLPGLLYADDLILCGESEEDLRVMVGWFVEVCKEN